MQDPFDPSLRRNPGLPDTRSDVAAPDPSLRWDDEGRWTESRWAAGKNEPFHLDIWNHMGYRAAALLLKRANRERRDRLASLLCSPFMPHGMIGGATRPAQARGSAVMVKPSSSTLPSPEAAIRMCACSRPWHSCRIYPAGSPMGGPGAGGAADQPRAWMAFARALTIRPADRGTRKGRAARRRGRAPTGRSQSNQSPPACPYPSACPWHCAGRAVSYASPRRYVRARRRMIPGACFRMLTAVPTVV